MARCFHRLRLLALATALVAALCTRGAETVNTRWAVRSWQSDDGLPNNTVMSIAQTPDGYLWLATATRLTRFDGVRFDAIPRDVFGPEFALHNVGAMTPSRDGGLWLLMNQGPLIHARNGELRFITAGLPVENVQSVDEHPDGTVWMLYRGEAVWRVKDCDVKRATSSDGMPGRTIGTFAADAAGNFWFAKGGVIGVIRDGHFDALAYLPKPFATSRIAAARQGGVWVATNTDLFRYTKENGVVNVGTFQPDQRGDEARALLEDRNGGVWIGTAANALFHYDGNGFEAIPTSQREVLCLFEDRDGSIWAGTAGGGLDLIRPRKVQLENASTGLPFDTLVSIAEDTNGGVWAVAQNGWLLRRDGERWVNMSGSPDWPQGLAACVASDGSGGVWVGTRSRALLHWANGRYQSWRDTDGLAMRNLHTLLVTRNGDVWLAGNGPEALQRLRNGVLTTFALPPNVRVIRAAAEDTNGNIWFGTSRGLLLRVEDEKIVDETALLGGIMSIRCITADEKEGIWLGFADFGVGRVKGRRFSYVTSDQGLHDDGICEIVSDGRGWMWFGSNQGLFKIRQDELDRAFEQRGIRVHSIVYGRGEGVPSLQATGGAAPNSVRTRDGRMWLPMTTGLVVVNPEPVTEESITPPVLLRRVVVDETVVASYGGVLPTSTGLDTQKLGAALRLPPQHRRLEFEWTALTFRAPENVRYRYQLQGFDDKWSEPGTAHIATYSRLPAGRYTFRVQAAFGSGAWSETRTPFGFDVEPFLWQAWWFQLLVLATFTGAIVATVRYVSFRRLRLRVRALEQQAALEKERARIARDIHDDVGNRLTKITLLSGLALQDRTEPDKAAEHIEKISSTARQITDSLDEIVWAVNPRNDTLAHLIDYIGQFTVEFLHEAGIQAELELPERAPDCAVAAEVRHNLFLVVKEALTNTVRHAGATRVRMHVATTDTEIELFVADNGRGFAHAPENGRADGLRNMRQRMTEIGGDFQIESSPGTGTKIRLRYPWVMLQRN